MKYLMYLRKSQFDRDYDQTSVQDTISRHKTILLDYCKKEKIHVSEILEEVVSGELLSERPQMMHLLDLVNTGDYEGVVCIDLDRLSRGDSADYGYITSVFKWNNTKIITPSKTYDFGIENDEMFAELKFMFARMERRTISKRMQAGIKMSLSEGKYAYGTPPYGYELVHLKGEKGCTLKVIPDQAEVVRLVYKWYSSGDGTTIIANRLQSMGIKPAHGDRWCPMFVNRILKNITYTGVVPDGKRPMKRYMDNGVVVKKRIFNANYATHKGLHEAIIDRETYDRVQEIFQRRMPSARVDRTLKNPFSELLVCGHCGESIYRSGQMFKGGVYKYRCHRYSGSDCTFSPVAVDVVEKAVVDHMREWLKNYKITIEPTKSKDNMEKQIKLLKKALNGLYRKRDKICDLLEQGVYDTKTYAQRNEVITKQITEAETAIKDLESNSDKKENLVPVVQGLLDTYEDLTAKQKNLIWKQLLEKVVITHKRHGDVKIEIFSRLPKDTTPNAL